VLSRCSCKGCGRCQSGGAAVS